MQFLLIELDKIRNIINHLFLSQQINFTIICGIIFEIAIKLKN